MAEQENILTRLGKLFQSNIVIRKNEEDKLVVKDINMSQTGLTSNFIDRYNRIFSQSSWAGAKYSNKANSQAAFDMLRRELFRDYEMMDTDSIISSALDVYSDESTINNVENETLKIKTDNQQVAKILHNLFYDVLNIEFNLWSWIRNLCKYGDFFLELDILDKYGVMNVKPISNYDVSRMEDHDPANPNLIEFEILGESGDGRNQESRTLQNYEVAHFRLLSDSNYLPYGKSMLEGGRKVWKQLTLMEDAMLIHRIMRAPEKRIFKLDIGNIPPNEVENFMGKVINKMKKTPVIDNKTGEYNLRYNIESVTEDYFLPVRGSDSGTSIDTLPGLANDNAIDDIEYLRNKMMAALKIPKAFLGYEEGVGSKATLAAEDVRFARTIERLQKIICAELEKIAIVHLYTQGFEDVEMINFDLELTNPSMIHAQEKLELLNQQLDAAGSIMEKQLFSREWIMNNIFEVSDDEQKKVFGQIIDDQKQAFRMEQIKMEGNDPFKTHEAKGTPHSLADMDSDEQGGGGQPSGGGGGFQPGTGMARSSDIKDAIKYEKERFGKREFKGKSPLATSKGATLVTREGLLKSLKDKFGKEIVDKSILSEEIILEDEESNE